MSTLLVPELTEGRGTGHLRRCIALLDALPESFLYIPGGERWFLPILESVPEDRVVRQPEAGIFDWVICDRFSLSAPECARFQELGPVVGIDVGGEGRSGCDYLVDTLPRVDGEGANRVILGAAVNPIRTRVGSAAAGRLLVSFGGEDPGRLTERVTQILADCGAVDPQLVTVVSPALRAASVPDTFTTVPAQPTLEPLLETHEMVITSFGLTAFEARRIGARVLLVHPSRYHKRLADRAGFVSAGVGRVRASTLRRFLAGKAECSDKEHAEEQVPALEAVIEELVPPAVRACPVHGGRGTAVFRSASKTYRRCERCGLVFLERFTGDTENYSAEYFMTEYKAQYGRTYLEDFDHIKEMGGRRLEQIHKLIPDARTLLDIGCAYGPFLAAADARGYDVCGIDVSKPPVEYVNRELRLNAFQGDFRDDTVSSSLPHRAFDVVSLWYVIEHFPDLASVLERLQGLVRDGGILALSTPHGAGVSAQRRPGTFYQESPRDHYTIWDRHSATKLLREYGFRVERIVVTGHHPERYPLVDRRLLPRSFARAHSRVVGWGDTFEIYARRVPEQSRESE